MVVMLENIHLDCCIDFFKRQSQQHILTKCIHQPQWHVSNTSALAVFFPLLLSFLMVTTQHLLRSKLLLFVFVVGFVTYMINLVLHEEVIFILHFYCFFCEKKKKREWEALTNSSFTLNRFMCLRKKEHLSGPTWQVRFSFQTYTH